MEATKWIGDDVGDGGGGRGGVETQGVALVVS